MTQHYQRNVAAVTKYCPTCGKMTLHQVDDRRVGRCREQHVFGMSKAQTKREAQRVADARQPDLFSETEEDKKL